MNLSEFKAWFEGFTENLDGPPGEKAWGKIQAKVKQIRDTPATSYPVFVDRYMNHPYTYPRWTTLSVGHTGAALQGYGQNLMQHGNPNLQAAAPNAAAGGLTGEWSSIGDVTNWNSSDAFRDLGRLEAAS